MTWSIASRNVIRGRSETLPLLLHQPGPVLKRWITATGDMRDPNITLRRGIGDVCRTVEQWRLTYVTKSGSWKFSNCYLFGRAWREAWTLPGSPRAKRVFVIWSEISVHTLLYEVPPHVHVSTQDPIPCYIGPLESATFNKLTPAFPTFLCEPKFVYYSRLNTLVDRWPSTLYLVMPDANKADMDVRRWTSHNCMMWPNIVWAINPLDHRYPGPWYVKQRDLRVGRCSFDPATWP